MVLSSIRSNSISHHGTSSDILVIGSANLDHIDSGVYRLVKEVV